MRKDQIILLLAVVASVIATGARANDLPVFARTPEPYAAPAGRWTFGSEIAVIGSRGQGARVGGAVHAGYQMHFDNNWIVAIRGSTGYAPAFTTFRTGANGMAVRGFDFIATDVKVAYRMGQLTPWASAGVALARPSTGSFYGAGESANTIFNSPDNIAKIGRVEAGVDYQINNKLSVGVSVGVQRGGF